MIRIGIEINGVIRNINKQILKYYQKDIDPSIDLDEIDETDDVFKYAKFSSNMERNQFIYIDYPYEIFGCAKTMDKDLPTVLNNWLSELTNYEDDTVEVSFYSLNEEALTIQSSYFFLSKIGTRVRRVFFPKYFTDIKDNFDVIITSNKDLIGVDKDKYYILIKNILNSECEDKANKSFNSLNEALKDENLLTDIKNFLEKNNE